MVYKGLCNLIPDRCASCGAATRRGFCATCRSQFVRLAAPCPRCALRHQAAECPLAVSVWHIDRVVAPFEYCEPLIAHIHALKFSRQRRIGHALGELLAMELLGTGPVADIDVLTAVPLHRKRLRERGYNQSMEIARAVAAMLGLPLMISGIERARATRPQAQLAAAERERNLHGAFEITRELAATRIALIDDVMTTGATLNALAAALKANGVERVDAWAVARAL